MALTPLPSNIGWGLNPRPSDREPSALPLDHGFRLAENVVAVDATEFVFAIAIATVRV